MRVEVDFDKCQSNALCMQTLPEVFDVHDDDGYLYILQEELRDDQIAAAQEAARICPTLAISLKP